MIETRPSEERGRGRIDWLESYHTFSFAEYYDPAYTNFSALRVINEDIIKPSHGFDTHPHQNMEIVTFVISGQLEHQDSMGNKGRISAGEIQRMSAGKGVLHSEFNPSESEPVHLLQIWIKPDRLNIAPSYEQLDFRAKRREAGLHLMVSPDGGGGSARIQQNARILLGEIGPGNEQDYNFLQERSGWIQVISGGLLVNGTALGAGDGAAISKEEKVSFESEGGAEFLLFDLPDRG